MYFSQFLNNVVAIIPENQAESCYYVVKFWLFPFQVVTNFFFLQTGNKNLTKTADPFSITYSLAFSLQLINY